jgi:hypothetical protein
MWFRKGGGGLKLDTWRYKKGFFVLFLLDGKAIQIKREIIP